MKRRDTVNSSSTSEPVVTDITLEKDELDVLRKIDAASNSNDFAQNRLLHCSGAYGIASGFLSVKGEPKMRCSDERVRMVAKLLRQKLIIHSSPDQTVGNARYSISADAKAMLQASLQRV